MMFTILFTALGRRVQLIQAFKSSCEKHGIPVKIVGVDANPEMAPACLMAERAYKVPLVSDDCYIDRLLEFCRKETVKLLIPLYEPEFLLLDERRYEFERQGTYLLLSDRSVLEICQDKWLTYQFFVKHGIKTPFTWTGDMLPGDIPLPLFCKPRRGMGSAGTEKIVSRTQLAGKQSPELLFQEFIAGQEYTLDVLADWKGNVLSVVPRERLEVRSGEVSKSRTVKRNDLIKEGKRIIDTLGAIGPVTLQCIDTGRDIFWTEINPRFGGGVPLTIKAGVDYPIILYKMIQGEDIRPFIGEFQDNLVMLRYDEAVYIEGNQKGPINDPCF